MLGYPSVQEWVFELEKRRKIHCQDNPHRQAILVELLKKQMHVDNLRVRKAVNFSRQSRARMIKRDSESFGLLFLVS